MFHSIARGAQAAKRHWRKGAVVTAVAATAVAFSGTGVAVAHGLIDSGRIQNQTIRSVDIGQNQVGASELRPGQNAAVRTEHLKDNGVRPHDLGNNFQADATNELEGYEVVGPEETWTGESGNETTAECPDGKVAIGGGWNSDDADTVNLTGAGLSDIAEVGGTAQATSYTVRGGGTDAPTPGFQMQAFVVCADHVENTFDD